MMRQVQRTFVYLRQRGSGRQSGYARAEGKEGSVRLNLVVQGFKPDDDAHAFAATDEGVIYIGPMLLDSRGQGGISADMSEREYRDVRLLFTALRGADGVDIPLAGAVGRGMNVTWPGIYALAEQALGIAAQEPVREEADRVEEPVQEKAMVAETAEEKPVEKETVTEEEPYDARYDAPAQEPVAQQETPEDVMRELRTPFAPERQHELPEMLRRVYWPQKLWPLHDLFERFEVAQPFGERANECYVRVPLGGKVAGAGYYLVGAKVEENWVTEVGYLVPGEKGRKMVGLEGYVWEEGYWQSWASGSSEE